MFYVELHINSDQPTPSSDLSLHKSNGLKPDSLSGFTDNFHVLMNSP